MIYEKPKATAAKVRLLLKKQFKGVAFSVTSDSRSMTSSVYIHWEDGPLESDVEQAVGWMASASVDGMQDMKITTGYRWEGEMYNGADYIEVGRTLTDERRQRIQAHLEKTKEPYQWPNYYRPIDREAAERDLVRVGELKGFPPADPCLKQIEPRPMDTKPTDSQPKKPGEVIRFPAPSKTGIENLTPEQRLKYEILEVIKPALQKLGYELTEEGDKIDTLFKRVANQIYG